ncbi:YhcH/YjgK/YiaL family protein [Blautia schinkii]|nr:YhcH/YjgK/YiaL family protein [Blautia schinkii]
MIVDKITNLTKYPVIRPFADTILAFIEKERRENLKDGRYNLDGDNLFALVQSYETKDLSQGLIESHEIYTDLQYIVKGEEYIYWNPLDELKLVEDRRPDGDIAFYDGTNVKNKNLLTQGMFGYYFPTDGHMPCISVEESIPMKKIVFKIKYENL